MTEGNRGRVDPREDRRRPALRMVDSLPANVAASARTRTTQVDVGTPAGLVTATVAGVSMVPAKVPRSVSSVTDVTSGVAPGSAVSRWARMRTHRSKSWTYAAGSPELVKYVPAVPSGPTKGARTLFSCVSALASWNWTAVSAGTAALHRSSP